MGLFSSLFKKPEDSFMVNAPIVGQCVPISEVNDPTFADEILGKGVAIKPTVGKVFSPVNGVVTTSFDTGHAVAITSEDGAEILIHVGLDTLNLKGKHFKRHSEENQKVKQGDLLIEVDLDGVRADGYDTITSIIICNTQDYQDVVGITGCDVTTDDEILKIIKK